MAQMLLGQNPNVLNMFPGLQRLLPNTSLPSIPTITAQPTYQGKHFIRLVNFPEVFPRKMYNFRISKNSYASNFDPLTHKRVANFYADHLFFDILRVVQTKSILFWNQRRKKTDPTYNDSVTEWWISGSTQNRFKMRSFKLKVVLCRIRLYPLLTSKIKWLKLNVKMAPEMSGFFNWLPLFYNNDIECYTV